MRKLLLVLPLLGVAVLAYRWYLLNAAPVESWAGFGATAEQCAAAYLPANLATNDRSLISPQTRGYVKGGWSVIVGFDEAGRAEQFVISKAALLTTAPTLSSPEQTNLLAKFGNGSRWIYQGDNGGIGPMWAREDEQGYASYITGSRWMVLMNRAGLERQMKAINLEVSPPDHR